MKKICLAGVAALVVLVIAAAFFNPAQPGSESPLGFGVVRAGGAEASAAALVDPAATVADFMQVVHGPKGLRMQVQAALSGSGPADDKAWRMVQARAAILGLLTTEILQNAKPQKGSPDSWKALVNEYQKSSEDLILATRAKDRRASFEHVALLGRSCKSCHKAHK